MLPVPLPAPSLLPAATTRLVVLLRRLVDKGNGLLVVECDTTAIADGDLRRSATPPAIANEGGETGQLLGALVLADTASRTLVAPQQLPVGVLTALFGVPVFLFLLSRQKDIKRMFAYSSIEHMGMMTFAFGSGLAGLGGQGQTEMIRALFFAARGASREASVTELTAPFAISQPSISKHLKVLERAGLISRASACRGIPSER